MKALPQADAEAADGRARDQGRRRSAALCAGRARSPREWSASSDALRAASSTAGARRVAGAQERFGAGWAPCRRPSYPWSGPTSTWRSPGAGAAVDHARARRAGLLPLRSPRRARGGDHAAATRPDAGGHVQTVPPRLPTRWRATTPTYVVRDRSSADRRRDRGAGRGRARLRPPRGWHHLGVARPRPGRARACAARDRTPLVWVALRTPWDLAVDPGRRPTSAPTASTGRRSTRWRTCSSASPASGRLPVTLPGSTSAVTG